MPLFRLFSSSSSNQWLSSSITIARGLVAAGNCAPLPCIGAALSAGLAFLEMIQTVGRTTDDLKYLAESVLSLMKQLQDESEVHPNDSQPRFCRVCEDFTVQLRRLSEDIEQMAKHSSSSRFKKYMHANCIQDEITRFTQRVADMRADATLVMTIGTRTDIVEIASAVSAVQANVLQIQDHLTLLNPTSSPGTSTGDEDLIRFGENFHALKIGDIQLKFGTASKASYSLHSHYGKMERELCWTDYKGVVNGSHKTIRVYQGSHSAEAWKGFLSVLAEWSPDPSVPQLFGFCNSPRLQSLVFHGEFATLDEYALSLSSSQDLVNWETSLTSDFIDLSRSHASRGYYDLVHATRFAAVDARNGKLIFTHLEISPRFWTLTAHDLHRVGQVWIRPHKPVLEWFCTSFAVFDSHPFPSPLLTPFGDRPLSLIYDQFSALTKLMRRIWWWDSWRHISGTPSLLSRGSIYDVRTKRAVMRLEHYKPTVSASWRVHHISSGDLDIQLRLNLFPRIVELEPANTQWTQFMVPFSKKGAWNSMIDQKPSCGYFLCAEVEFGENVPDVTVPWLAQSTTFSLHEFDDIPSFVVPIRTALRLKWEMTLREDCQELDAALDMLPPLHVFVEVPIIQQGQISEPQIYWSTDPHTKLLTGIPAGLFKVRFLWSTGVDFARWKKHHYDVAKSIQEQNGFDPSTNAAAQALGLPLLVPCEPALRESPPDEEVTNWCSGKQVVCMDSDESNVFLAEQDA
ncbi:hypothetical protein R3P38DRAFT_2882667 [Favolaschia claudopus]|uniref:Fungal N-terminal domain-containing protein n=1 Tax=Favolaschia claudopus TaxID=2862362 RepID=A0AAW0D193_9AGAR